MITWIIVFLVVSLIAGILGFTTLASGLASLAKIIFYLFLALLVISLIIGAVNGF
jgi:uncharacterized membrane protein YtjA (UPF0391 family)